MSCEEKRVGITIGELREAIKDIPDNKEILVVDVWDVEVEIASLTIETKWGNLIVNLDCDIQNRGDDDDQDDEDDENDWDDQSSAVTFRGETYFRSDTKSRGK